MTGVMRGYRFILVCSVTFVATVFLLPIFTKSYQWTVKGYLKTEHEKKVELWHKYLDSVPETPLRKRYPDVIVVGVEKCGTGSLVGFIGEHPLIKKPKKLEQFFFSKDNYIGELPHYLEEMPSVHDHEVIIEKTPAYFKRAEIPNRIHKTIPDAKIIVIMCDPVNRTYSDFKQHIMQGIISEDKDFDNMVGKIMKRYGEKFLQNTDDFLTIELMSKFMNANLQHIVTSGLYYYYLRQWLKTYKIGENLLVLDGEDFLKRPWITVEKVQDFINIPKLITEENFVKDDSGFYCRKNWAEAKEDMHKLCMNKRSKGRSRFSTEMKWNSEPLRRYFALHNKKLFSLLGVTFDWQV